MASVISIQNLSKRYVLTRSRSGEGFRHLLEDALKMPFRAFGGPRKVNGETTRTDFWALRELSCEISEGDIIGIIGRNGAGKSTLLKVLSRITEPTSGIVRLRGRVASLLEVGTGFHPELTGRENIFLNGAILGMSRAEIRANFDQIVTFAEIEQFLDTPVKRYSSGMYVRLAFAVAAHLDPEILVVDEVLAVGDVAFQKKCLGKIGEVARGSGRTVLFVSHSMSAITQLCNRAVFLNSGRLVADGGVDEVVSQYLRLCSSDSIALNTSRNFDELRRHKKLFFTKIQLFNAEGVPSNELDVRQPFHVRVEYEVPRSLNRIELSVRVLAADGRPVMTSLQSALAPEVLDRRKEGLYEAQLEFPGMFLMPGSYFINVAAHHPVGEVFDVQENAVQFTIQDTGTHFAPYKDYHSIGLVLKEIPWAERKL